MRIEAGLFEEIHSELEELKKSEVGTESYRTTVDGVTKLIDRAIEIEKLNIDHEDRVESLRQDTELKLMQMEEDRKGRWVRDAIAVAGIIIPTAVTIWGTLKSFEFEKEGTVTTIMGRGFIQKLLPKK